MRSSLISASRRLDHKPGMSAVAVPLTFQRASVADQVESALAAAIAQGLWGGTLPGGHELARRLGTSRDAVRIALARLAKAGILSVKKGRCAELHADRRARPRPIARTICVVAPMERKTLAHLRATSSLFEVHAAMVGQGVIWEEIFDATLASRLPERRLQRLVASHPGVCWILILATSAMQRWFQAAGVPVLVMGTCHEGVSLPSVDLDYRALGWHAAGRIRQKGHRHVGLVLPDTAVGGDLACRNGFRDYLARPPNPLRLQEIAAGPDAVHLEATLDRLFSRPERPTAIFAMKSTHALTVFGYLLVRGYRIPEDVSVVSRDSHTLFDFGLPRLARYRGLAAQEAAHVVRMMQSLLAGRRISTKPIVLMPAFVAGETLGAPPA